ncbi:MAG: TetR family transcriptional regulator [Chloroflexi bacterium]|nr:TetR family transcriptional regulator [Chloroflexota bacterium]
MLLDEVKVDPRVKRTRQLLQKALMDLLEEQPFHTITVQDIAARAEVNRATFYAHFEDKFALLNYSLREHFQGLLDAKLPPEPALTLENLRIVTVTVHEFLNEFLSRCAPTHQATEEAMMVMQVQRQLHDTVLAWVTRVGAQADGKQQAEVIATVVSWAIWGTAVQQGGCHGYKLPPNQIADQVLALLKTGLQDHLQDGV